MANPRQRRKAKSGTPKVRPSRRSSDRAKKIIVQGPPGLVKQWDVRKTALQNYAALGLAARRPLALRQSGGVEKELIPASEVTEQLQHGSSDSDSDSDSDPDEDEDMASDDGPAAKESVHGSTSLAKPSSSTAAAGDRAGSRGKSAKSSKSPKTLTSRDIPKGFARIERDEKGQVIRVVMSAWDDPGTPTGEHDQGQEDEEEHTNGDDEDEQSAQDTPWGRPLNDEAHERAMQENAVPVPAKNPAVADLEARSKAEASIKASSTRFASPAELETLRTLVRKHGNDVVAMSRDIKVNTAQRTAGQLRKAIERCGGFDKLAAA